MVVHLHGFDSKAVPINQCDVSEIVIFIQIEDLKWELEQRQREIDAQKQQQEMVEQCHLKELDNLQRALQVSV